MAIDKLDPLMNRIAFERQEAPQFCKEYAKLWTRCTQEQKDILRPSALRMISRYNLDR
jgi:hypothetical protein